MHCGDFLIKISDKMQMTLGRSDYLVGRIRKKKKGEWEPLRIF